jgi:predicted MPP superfamily phosphohydrolase
MTTIIISDLHNRVGWIEPALKKLKDLYNYDEVVFLGDYFDNVDDTPFIAGGTASWLKTSLEHDDRIHLIGNHDMPYIPSLFPANQSLWCPGYSLEKAKVVHKIIDHNWDRLKPAYYTQGQLLSHAGFSEHLHIHPITGPRTPEMLVEMASEALETLSAQSSPIFAVGSRMGSVHTGGITWCDWNDEFTPCSNIDQIVGHTPSPKVRREMSNSSINYCMDTFNQHIGLIQDGVVTFLLRSQTLGF